MIPLPFQHTVGRSPCAPPGQRIGSTPILFSCAASLTCCVSWKSFCLSTGSLHLKVASPVELPRLPLFQLCFDSEAELARGFGSWSPTESRSPPETGWHSPLFSSGSGVVTGNTWKINSKIWVCVGGEHWKKGEIPHPGPWNKTKTFVFPWWLDDLVHFILQSQWSLDLCYPGLGLHFFSMGLIPGLDTCRKKGNTINISEENFEKNILYNLQMLTLYFYIRLTKLSDAHTCHCVHIKQPKAKEIAKD